MAQKIEYIDLDVKGSLSAEKIINPNEPTNHLLRADGKVQDPTNPLSSGEVLQFQANGDFNQIWFLLQYSLLLSNNDNCVKKEDRLIELIDNETGDISTYSVYFPTLSVGKTLRWTAFNPNKAGSLVSAVKSNFQSLCLPFSVYITNIIRNATAIYTVEYYRYTNATGDSDADNQANYEWVTVFSKEMPFRSTIVRIPSQFITTTPASYYLQNIRVSIKPTSDDHQAPLEISNIDVFYYAYNHKSLLNSNRLINYDANIEPTQTGTEFKTLPWWMQYITQGVNWLKKNYLPASTLDTKTISDFLDLSASQVNYFVDSTLTDSIFNQKVTFPADWEGRKICLSLSPVVFQKDYDYSLKVMFANYMKATGARLFVENDLAAMVGVNTLIKIIIDNNIIVVEAYIEA